MALLSQNVHMSGEDDLRSSNKVSFRRPIFSNVSLAIALLTFLCGLKLSLAQTERASVSVRFADQSDAAQPVNLVSVPQPHVDQRTVVPPVLDRNGIRFRRLSTDDGLSQTMVTQILQDDQGFIWFASMYGLNRYDGYKFKVFKHEPGNPNSLSGVHDYSLFKDHSGMLWIGSEEFLDKFDPVSETATHYRIGTQGETFPVIHISEDHTGMLWLATKGGLYRFDPSTGQSRRYEHDPNDPFSLSSNVIRSTGEDKEGTLWVASSEGVDAFDWKAGKVTFHIPLEEPGSISFHEDRFGVLWIVHATGGGLAAFDRRTNTLTQYSFHKAHLSDALPTGMMAVLEDRDGNLWFGTLGDGLLKFDRKEGKFTRYRNDQTDIESLGEDNVASLFQDREGNIWVGLHMMAPNYFAPRPPLFEKFKHEPGNANSFSGTMVNGIYQDRQGTLWISAIDGLNRVDRKTGKYTFYRIEGPRVNWRPTAIVEDKAGFLWAGSDGHGLVRFEPKTGRFKTFRHNFSDPSSLSDDVVIRLLIDRSGRLWATTFNGLDRFDPVTSRFTVYKAKAGVQTDIDLKEDPAGMLWIGTEQGLQRFDPSTEQFTVYTHNTNEATSLSNNRVNSVYFDHTGIMWVGTQDGLDKFDRSTATFKTYYEQDGLSGNVVSCILEDDRGNLWMSTNKGISKFDASRETFKTYTTADGLPGTDLTGWGACSKSSSGEMFFGGFSGGVAFYPDKVIDDPYVPPVVLTDFRLFDHPVAIGPDSPLRQSIGYTRGLTLSHSQSIFSFEFSALNFFNPGGNRYRYMLEGLDREWHEVGSDQRLVTYTTLPGRKYTFRVQGATSRGAWSEPGVALPIEILPAWWNTWWFRTVYVGIFIALLWALYRWRTTQLMAQETHLRDVVDTIPAMTFTTSPDGSITFVNKGWIEYTGLSVEQTSGACWQRAIHPDDLARYSEKWRISIATGQPFEDEARFRRSANGDYRWFLVRGVPLRNRDKKIVKWYGTLTDIEDRRCAEEGLRRSKAYLSEAQKLSETGSFAWSPTRDNTYFSDECCRLLGFEPGGTPPRLETIMQRIHPEDQEYCRDLVARSIQEKVDKEFDYRIIHRDGSVRNIHCISHPVLDKDGNLDEFIGTVIDVTERKRAEEALQRSQFYINEGQRLAHMGSWAFNPLGFFDYWSDELFQIYGLDPKKGPPTLEQYLATLHSQDRDSMAETIKTMHLQRCGCDVKKRIVRPEGQVRYVRCVGIPVIKDDVLKGFLGSAVDVTEQELLMRELERREAYLAESQGLNRTGTLASDPTTMAPTYWSRECLRMWGFDPESGLPTTETILQRIHPEDRKQVCEHGRQIILSDKRSGEKFTQEFRIVLPGGTLKHIRSASHILLGAHGEPVEVLGTHVEITEQKRAEQERERLHHLEADLAHINRVSMLGEMAASLAHEIKQPIAAAITSANTCIEWLAHDPPNLDRARAAAARIDKYGNRAAEIIDHIRSLYKKAPSQRELVDVNGIVQEIFTLLRDEAIRSSITMHPNLASELPKINADRVQLQQVFMNLMLNAVEAMKNSGGELTVTSQVQTGQLQFSVADTGVGLPTEDVDRIFSAFFTTKPQGSGMGLAISRSIVESHSGRLWATANNGRGTTFHFTLPLLPTESTPASS